MDFSGIFEKLSAPFALITKLYRPACTILQSPGNFSHALRARPSLPAPIGLRLFFQGKQPDMLMFQYQPPFGLKVHGHMQELTVYHPQQEKIRLGKSNDGGYVICILPDGYDCIITGGIADDISFEQDLLNRYPGLKCYAFDGTITELPEPDDRITFIRKNLGAQNGDLTTNLHCYLEPYSNVFMKIDIEGNEFRLLPALTGDYLGRIKQLVIEIHSPGFFQYYREHFPQFTDVTHTIMFDMFALINRTHTLVHLHPNNACGTHVFEEVLLPDVFECTYIRNDFVTGRVKNTLSLPTRYDMPNVLIEPDITLSSFPFSFDKGPSDS